jgi:hypothetical protein
MNDSIVIDADGTWTNTAWNTTTTSSVNGGSAESVYQDIQGTNYCANAVTGAVTVPSGATIQGANGVLATVLNDSSGTNAVAVQGYAIANASSAQVWGANFLASSSSGLSAGCTVTGIEIDLHAQNANDSVAGVTVGGPGPATLSTLSSAFRVSGGSNPFEYGFTTQDGAANLGVALGCTTTGNTVPSQTIQLASRDSSGNVHFGYITTNANGAFNFQPDVVNNSAIFVINKIGFPVTPAHVFANLPSPSSGTAGALVYITDSPTATVGATVTVGGGTNKVYLGTGGTNWTVIALTS